MSDPELNNDNFQFKNEEEQTHLQKEGEDEKEEEEEGFVSTFPPPPPFYKLYRFYEQNNNNYNYNYHDNNDQDIHTSENEQDKSMSVGDKRPSPDKTTDNDSEEKNKNKNENENEFNDDSEEEDIIDEESVAMYYEPPLPPYPIEGVYHMFGGLFTTEYKIPSIEEEFERMQLYSSFKTGEEKIKELKKLNRSLLFNFLELMKILINNPTAEIERQTVENIDTLQHREDEGHKLAALGKVEQIELIMSNMGYLLNSYRPHQAYDQLIHIVKEQIERKHNSVQDIQLAFGKCRKILQNMRNTLETTVGCTFEDEQDVDMVVDDHHSQTINRKESISLPKERHVESISIPNDVQELIQTNLY